VRSLQESTPKARTAMLPTTPPTKTNELTGLVNNAGLRLWRKKFDFIMSS
jgi:hypothetical protein